MTPGLDHPDVPNPLDIVGEAVAAPERITGPLHCLNGPCAGTVDVPIGAVIGQAVGLPWRTVTGVKRYAVYVIVAVPEHLKDRGPHGLMYIRTHETAERAQRHVGELTQVARMQWMEVAT